ncbi:MAG TPA: polysaccharide biosynthesis C-terminal domain-containing protein [Labilithrix sp.]|nr:polysaccharide biosynthesis C-terminal domain-containing protein [Labilithrix sp.]
MTITPKKPSKLLPVANVITSQFATALGIAGSFVITPTMLSGLGEAKNGGWQLMLSFVSYMKFLDLGTSAGTVKYGAGALARGDEEDLRKVVNSTTAIFLGVGTLSTIGTLILAVILPRIYSDVGLDPVTIVMLGAALAIDLLSRTFAAALRTRSLFFVCDSVEILTFVVFRLGFLIYFAHHGGLTYRLLGTLVLLDTVCKNGFVTGAALFLTPYVRKANPFKPARDMIKKLTKMGSAMSIMQIADIVRFQLDAGVIAYFMVDAGWNITIFSIGTRLPSIAYTAIGVIGAVLMPRFSGLSETGDQEGLKALLKRANLATGLIASFVLVNIAVLGPHFLELWLKKPWVPTSGKILLVMLPGYFVALLTGPSAGVLVGGGRLRGLTMITVGEAVLNFVLSVALVKAFGIFGVAFGTVIPMIVVRGIVFPLLLKKELGITPLEYARMHARPVLLGLVYLALVCGLGFIPLVSYVRFFLLAGLSTVVFFTLLLAVVPEARAAVPKLLAKLPGRRKVAASE